MKIALLIWNFIPFTEGGAEKQCRLITEELSRKGLNCLVITARLNRKASAFEKYDNFYIYRLGDKIVPWMNAHASFVHVFRKVIGRKNNDYNFDKMFGFWFRLIFLKQARKCFVKTLLQRAIQDKWDFDVVHVFESSWLAGVGEWLGEIVAGKTICRCASWPAWQTIPYDAPMRKVLAKRRLSTFYAAMNNQMIENLIQNGIPRNKCFLVPNGVATPNAVSDVKTRDTVLYIGNFFQGYKWKGFDILIQAWDKVVKIFPKARLIMVGSGDYLQWKQLSQSLECDNNITWAGETRDTESYYSKCGIFVLPSRVEGMSNALLEAQSWGLACVVSDIPGNRAIVENGKNGILFPKEDINRLAESIVMLLKNPEMRVKLGTEARRQTENRFALPAVAERWIQVYKTILNA